MVIQNVQRITVLSVFCLEFPFEVRLPHVVAGRFLEVGVRLSLQRFFFQDAAVAFQNIVNRLDTRQILTATSLHNTVNAPGSPAWILTPKLQDLCFCF